MDGWRTAEVFLSRLTVAVVLFAAVVFASPRTHHDAPSDESDVARSSKAGADLRFEALPELAALTRCLRNDDLSGDTIQDLKQAAASKDPVAEYALGVAYLSGKGVRCNADRASDYLDASADADFAPALYLLGVMAETGRGLPKSLADAAGWYGRAALAGNVMAMRRLGQLLVRGKGIDRDNRGAFEWYMSAAKYGDTDSQVNLGLMYGAGEDYGLKASPAEAYYWFVVAAQLGDAGAGDLRQTAARSLDSDELIDANHRANAWRPEPVNSEANADFDSIVAKLALPTEPKDTTEPTIPTDTGQPSS